VSEDAVLSENGGVLILVTGSSTTADGVCQRFTQSFFLAPQEGGGYFVLNDILRVMPETPPVAINQESSGSSRNDGSVPDSEPREAKRPGTDDQNVAVENKVGDWEVLNHTGDGTAAEANVGAEPPAVVTEDKEGPKENPDADASPTPPQKKSASWSCASVVTSLFSRLLSGRG
jgi:hypothetical protein